VTGNAELPYDQNIKGSIESLGYLKRDRYSASG
jgi:hypothetical protein